MRKIICDGCNREDLTRTSVVGREDKFSALTPTFNVTIRPLGLNDYCEECIRKRLLEEIDLTRLDLAKEIPF